MIRRGGGLDGAGCVAVGDVEGEHAAEAGIADGGDLGVLGEAARELLRGRRLALDADAQRLQAAEEEPGGIRGGDGAGVGAELAQAGGVVGVAADDRAEQRVVVPGEVLRRRVEDEVAAALERAQVDGRGRRRVADGRSGMGGGRLEVRHRQERVGGRLDPDEVGVGRRRPGLVEEDVAEAPAPELGEGDAGAVVGVLRERDCLAGLEQRERDRGRRGRAGGEEDGLAAVELPERPLGLGAGRMRGARVVEVAHLAVLVGPDRRAVERRLHAATIPHRGELSTCACVAGTQTSFGAVSAATGAGAERAASLVF